jgi:hypothetical protein
VLVGHFVANIQPHLQLLRLHLLVSRWNFESPRRDCGRRELGQLNIGLHEHCGRRLGLFHLPLLRLFGFRLFFLLLAAKTTKSTKAAQFAVTARYVQPSYLLLP